MTKSTSFAFYWQLKIKILDVLQKDKLLFVILHFRKKLLASTLIVHLRLLGCCLLFSCLKLLDLHKYQGIMCKNFGSNSYFSSFIDRWRGLDLHSNYFFSSIKNSVHFNVLGTDIWFLVYLLAYISFKHSFFVFLLYIFFKDN